MLMIPNDNDNTMNTKAVIEIVIDGLTRIFFEVISTWFILFGYVLYIL